MIFCVLGIGHVTLAAPAKASLRYLFCFEVYLSDIPALLIPLTAKDIFSDLGAARAKSLILVVIQLNKSRLIVDVDHK